MVANLVSTPLRLVSSQEYIFTLLSTFEVGILVYPLSLSLMDISLSNSRASRWMARRLHHVHTFLILKHGSPCELMRIEMAGLIHK